MSASIFEDLEKQLKELKKEFDILKKNNDSLRSLFLENDKKYKIRYDLPHPDYKYLHRIEALKDFKGVSKGSIGGYIERESNLSQEGNCWIFDNAIACDRSKVFEDACLEGKAVANKRVKISGRARVQENALITNNSQIFDDAVIKGYAIINGATVFENALITDRASAYEDSEIGGNSLLQGDCKIFGKAIINGDADISSRAKICGETIITDNAIIDTDVLINGDAYITSKFDFLFIKGLGLSFTFFKTKDKTIKVTLGNGMCLDYSINIDLDKFEKLCSDETTDNLITYSKDYLSFIEVAREVLK